MLEMNGSKQYNEASNEIKKLLAKQASEEIQTMDENTLKAVQAVLNFMDAAECIIAEQEKALQTVDEKIDELLKIVESK